MTLNFTYKKPKELISKGNPKLLKGLKRGWLDEGWCGAQSDVSVRYGGIEMCANKSPRCNALCIFKQGRGRFSNVAISRIRKSVYFAQEKVEFMERLSLEISTRKAYAKRKGLFYAFRPNVYTDREEFWRSGLMDEHPDVQFHDYTKNPLRMLKYLQGKLPKNYHLTFSRSENNEPECLDILSKGGNVAVVFNPYIPKWYEGYPVITGDETDLRHLDPKGNPKDGGYVIGLLAKGDAKSDKDNFVIQFNKGDN